MNWLDRSISWFDPQAGLRRARARALTATAQLSYEGAKTGRRTDGWITSGNSANAETATDLSKLRERSRSLIRDNHFAAKAALEFVGKVIGSGITAWIADERVAELWAAWQKQCSADGLPHFMAIESMVARTVFESGECLVRRRMRTASVASGMAVPIQLQILEPDYLDSSKTENLSDGGYIIQGVEFNSRGQRVAYWLFPQHPGETLSIKWQRGFTSNRVPASEVLHIADVTTMRPGQVRGVPHLSPVLLAIRDIDDWEDAEIIRKKTEACLAGVVTDPNGEQTLDSAPLTDSAGRRVETLSPGMVAYGAPGFDVKFNQPSHAGGYADYKRSRVRDLAAGIGMPYELLAGDLSQVNYSSYRGGLLSFRDRIESFQWNVMIPMLCEPVWRWFIAAAVDFSGLPSNEYSAEWRPPAFDLLDREAEAQADSLMLLNGTMTWPQAVQRQGEDPEKQLAEIAKWKPRLDAAGVTFTQKGANNGTNNQASSSAA